MEDLSKLLGREVKIDVAGFGVLAEEAATHASSESSVGVATQPAIIAELQSPKYQASKLGFTEGAHVALHKADQVRIYRVDSVSDTIAVLIEQTMGTDGKVIEVGVQTLMISVFTRGRSLACSRVGVM